MSTWLYQFWFFPFKTVKHWGRGPRGWTESLPVALPQVVKAAKNFPDEMLQEAFGFSIIGRTLT